MLFTYEYDIVKCAYIIKFIAITLILGYFIFYVNI